MRSIKEYSYSDLYIGLKESFSVKLTEEMENSFRTITGDINPMHYDDEFAKEMKSFDSHICFGMLTASFISTLAGVYLPGKYSLIHSVEIGFSRPVYIEDELLITGEVIDKQDDLNLIIISVKIKNQFGKIVLKGTMKNILQR